LWTLGLPKEAAAQAADVLVADLRELPTGTVKTAKFHGLPVLVLNLDGSPRVLSALCTHEGCTVEWDPRRKLIQCACHGGLFDGAGKVVEGPPPAALLELPVRVEDGKVYVVE